MRVNLVAPLKCCVWRLSGHARMVQLLCKLWWKKHTHTYRYIYICFSTWWLWKVVPLYKEVFFSWTKSHFAIVPFFLWFFTVCLFCNILVHVIGDFVEKWTFGVRLLKYCVFVEISLRNHEGSSIMVIFHKSCMTCVFDYNFRNKTFTCIFKTDTILEHSGVKTMQEKCIKRWPFYYGTLWEIGN